MKAMAFVSLLLVASTSFAVTPFSLPWMNHKTAPGTTAFNSADYKDGIFVVEAYFLGCSYCNQNAPAVNDLAEKYANEARVHVLDVGIDTSDSQYQTWINKHQPNHPVLKDSKRELIKQLGTSGYPSTYVIDSSGIVVTKTSGSWNAAKKAQLMSAIDGLLKTDPQ